MSIRTKRIYEAPAQADGYRVLVDRVWPRGLRKDEVQLDAWLKVLAPSTELRKWFAHDPQKWSEFKRRYVAELKARDEAGEALSELGRRARRQRVTLLFAARDTEHNNAVALREYLQRARRD